MKQEIPEKHKKKLLFLTKQNIKGTSNVGSWTENVVLSRNF